VVGRDAADGCLSLGRSENPVPSGRDFFFVLPAAGDRAIRAAPVFFPIPPGRQRRLDLYLLRTLGGGW